LWGSALNEQSGEALLRLGRGRIFPILPLRLTLAWAGENFCGGLTIFFLALSSLRGKG